MPPEKERHTLYAAMSLRFITPWLACEDPHVSTCALCGRSLDAHDRHVRFRLPDPVLRLPDQDRSEGTWKSEKDPNAAVMMQVPNVGAFLRALLPVQLTGGYTVTFGVWIGVHSDDLKRAFETWWLPEYTRLTMEGRLANALPAWDVLGVPVEIAVTDPQATPYCVSSSDQQLRSVLADQWEHELILSGLPA